MTRSNPSFTRLTAVLLAVFSVAATGQPQAEADNAEKARKELAQAREELRQAAEKVAELSREAHPGMERVQRFRTGRPMLGVLLAPDEAGGVKISGVTPESAAADAGLKFGDRITHIDGKAIAGKNAQERVREARTALSDLSAEKPVELRYLRDGKTTTARVTPRPGRNAAFVLNTADGGGDPGKVVRVLRSADGNLMINGERIEIPQTDLPELDKLSEDIGKEIHRSFTFISNDGKHDFALGALSEAFRWNGLNLASVDSRLGRYFGTDRGVLVLSTGEDLAGLEAGDVILSIEGNAVNSPREAMAALREKPEGSEVAVQYLRDRATRSTRLKVPAASFQFPEPPEPPTPPAPPAAPPSPPVPPLAYEPV